jgi:hypothetical protein
MSNGHATLSPSGWKQWSTCPGSVAACDGLPDSTSVYADEGTGAHEVLEKTLLRRYDVFGSPSIMAAEMVGQRLDVADEGQEPRLVLVTEDMAEHVQTVLDYVERRRLEMSRVNGPENPAIPVMVVSERRVSPAWVLGSDDCNGTADVLLISDREVEVVDYKHGRGVAVEVGTTDDPNGQMMLYLLGLLGEWRLRVGQTCRITVAQPRAEHPDGPIRSVGGMGEKEVSAFAARARAAIAAAKDPAAPRVASEDGCRWCRAKGTCASYARWSAAAVGAPTDWDRDTFLASVQTFATQDPGNMTPAETVRVLQGADLLRGFLGAVEEWAHAQLVRGTAPAELSAAYKLVNGRSQRRWAAGMEEESIATALTRIRWKDPATEKTTGLGKKDVYSETLRSPSQIEGLLKKAGKNGVLTSTHWETFNRLVEKPEGKLQLAPVTDDRPAATPKDPAVLFGGADAAGAPPDLPQPAPAPAVATDNPVAI